MFAVYVLLAMYYKQSKVINLALLCWKGRGGKKEKYSQCLEREREKRNGNVQLKSVNLTSFNILMVELWESIIRLELFFFNVVRCTGEQGCRHNWCCSKNTEASIMLQYGKVWELMPYSSRGKPVKLNSCIIPSTEGMVTWLEPSCTRAPWHSCMRTPVMSPYFDATGLQLRHAQ